MEDFTALKLEPNLTQLQRSSIKFGLRRHQFSLDLRNRHRVRSGLLPI